MRHHRFKTEGMRNLRMNEETYRKRQVVMNHIRSAKKLLKGDMPRIELRITERHETRHNGVLGRARLNDRVVWIPEFMIDHPELKQVVYHEILHAAYGVAHNERCPLMGAYLKTMTDKEIDERFLYWVARRKKCA